MAGRIDYESLEKSVKLDVKDHKILGLLAQDSRMALTQIAKKVQLSRDAVDYRIKRMVRLGVILRFYPRLNYEKMGYRIFHIFLLVDEKDQAQQKAMIEWLEKHESVFSVIEYTDRWDYEISVLAKDHVEFDEVYTEITSKFSSIILEKSLLGVIKKFNVHYIPTCGQVKRAIPQKAEPVKFDKIDIKLLHELSKDARMSTYKLGEKLKLSADAVSYRIKNLLKNEVVKNFTILVNLSLLKRHWYTVCINMNTFSRKEESKFSTFIENECSAVRSAKTLGPWDTLSYIAVDSPKGFHDLMKQAKHLFADVIKNYDVWVAYKEHFFKTMPEVIAREAT